MKLKLAEIIGTVLYFGKSPFAPGTVGSLVALGLWFILKPYIIDPLFLLITGGIFFIGIVVSTVLIEAWNKKDPKEIVIDEWGQNPMAQEDEPDDIDPEVLEPEVEEYNDES